MVQFDLEALGWNATFDAAFEPHRAAGLIPGRVALEHNHVYRVFTADGERLAEASGRIKYLASGRHELPTVGDWVALRPDDRGTRSFILAILPRTSSFSRKAAGRETAEQIVAANIDAVLLVFGLDIHVKPRSIERYLVRTRESGAAPIIVLNKADMCEDVPAAVAQAAAVAGGAPVHAVSMSEGRGLDVLIGLLEPGRTMALLGPSGAGKSTIVNRLTGDGELPTGEVRPWDARGRHTSVHRQLVLRSAGGVIIDTPGMREIQLWETDEGVDETFADITVLGESCRFRDCQHDQEPGCAVKAATETGVLDEARYAGYLKLQRERVVFERKHDERLQQEAKRRAKITERAYRHLQKDRGRDV